MEKKNKKRYCSVIEQESQPPISTRQALHCVWCSDKENERVTQLQMRILHKKKYDTWIVWCIVCNTVNTKPSYVMRTWYGIIVQRK